MEDLVIEKLLIFFNTYGWQLSLIALLGIVLLGILKFANVFANVPKEKRKIVYFTITIGFSLIASIIFLVIVDNFTIEYIVGVAGAIYTLNQTFYTLYENTSLRDLLMKLLDLIKKEVLRNKKQ